MSIMNIMRIIKNLSALMLGLMISVGAGSHPHSWITLKSSFELNDQNQLIEIKQTWTFDTYYSLITIADIMNTYGDETLGLQMMANDMATNLGDYNYFSSLSVDGKSITIPRPKATLSIKGEKEDAILSLDMHFTLDEPVTLLNKDTAWSVYDPTYYISMNHESVDDVSINTNGAMECGKELVLPNPTDEQIEYASSLDKTQRNTQGLGELFAEIIKIQCI